jgi:hypothetical protein
VAMSRTGEGDTGVPAPDVWRGGHRAEVLPFADSSSRRPESVQTAKRRTIRPGSSTRPATRRTSRRPPVRREGVTSYGPGRGCQETPVAGGPLTAVAAGFTRR